MYAYCVYPAMSKSPKQLPDRFQSCLILLLFLIIALHESGTRKVSRSIV